MIFCDGKPIEESKLSPNIKGKILCFTLRSKAFDILSRLNIPQQYIGGKSVTCFESCQNFDYMSLWIPQIEKIISFRGEIEIYFAPNRLFFFYDQEEVILSLLEEIQSNADMEAYELDRVLYLFFSKLTEKDAGYLEEMEEEVANLEDSIADENQINYTKAISILRKRLLKLKRYYEALVDLLEDLEKNQNYMLSEEQLRLFHFQTRRVNRHYNTVLNLRDYVTQVREAYQAQIDIELNQTMKFFTVIAAIFLPLSLIAGWYGMNVKMPESDFPYSYFIIIAVSAMVVAGSILYFKKNKWF